MARELVDEQFPQWRNLAITAIGGLGTVNAIFRVGDLYSARFPLLLVDPDEARRHLEAEVEAAKELLGQTRFPTPEPIGIGEPTASYPSPWSVQKLESGGDRR